MEVMRLRTVLVVVALVALAGIGVSAGVPGRWINPSNRTSSEAAFRASDGGDFDAQPTEMTEPIIPPGATASPEDPASSDPDPGDPDPSTAAGSAPDVVSDTEVPTGPPPPPPPPETRPALIERLEALVTGPDLAVASANLEVAVRDEYGRPLLDHNSTGPVLPASTQKLVTAASALLTFGPDHTFATTASAKEPVTDTGTVVGDLVLVGSGDPVLGTPLYSRYVYPARPRTPLENLADSIVAAGVTRITGGVVGDGTAFSGPQNPTGWKERYFWDFDARTITGLTVDAGLRYTIDGIDGDAKVKLELAPDPAAEAAAALYTLLVERGVTIEGGVRSAAETVPVTTFVAEVRSAPLADLLKFMMQRSDNHMADTIFRAAGLASAATSSWATGDETAREALALIGVELPQGVLADGSGLSRDDRLSAAYLADLDAAMGRSELREVWWSLMSIAGREGTLRKRLRGTIGEGRFLGKTGTLDDVMAVAGVVQGTEGRRYHLAVIANDARGNDRTVVRTLMDQLALVLAEDLDGCTRVALPPPPPPPPVDPAAPPPDAAAAPPGPPPPPTPPYVTPYRLECPPPVPTPAAPAPDAPAPELQPAA